ncbi:hypothetical protein ABZ816_10065 [Actinosynnema sp. NPDC047251]|uniref:Septum formation initiator n=1 Tax=Saccharothrix espanaensis (strain ATCC 51144 / DSM 44229 / JCM 9112 / NBRC 15066 / NRRL 15764) TaxID=1179773 RepID=K0K754_SACES|nr:hypothetical protein [Saccharothrix espanaensis]CCH34156.1 hypothetical protein BN6_69190 [Saccharothrix espanaensis DSM 44229]
MTAPARTNGVPSSPAKPRERALKSVPARSRSAAAERAYARRAQRSKTPRGPAVTRRQAVAPKAPFVVMVMVVLGVGIAAIMWLSTQATADSYRLQDARAEETRLARQVEQLRQEVALAESPLKLAEAAAKLGLVAAGDPARLKQLPDGTIEVYGKPSEAKAPEPPPAEPTEPQNGQPQNGQPDPDAQQQAGQNGQPDPNAQQPPAQNGQPDPNAQQPGENGQPGGQ